MSVVPDPVVRAEEHCRRKGLLLVDRLGFGLHGSVFAAENQIDGQRTAVKAHERERFYKRERNIYQRLLEHSVAYVRGAAVPQLLGHDDELWVLEMTIVSRPFVLDFAGAYLDFPPDYSASGKKGTVRLTVVRGSGDHRRTRELRNLCGRRESRKHFVRRLSR